MFDKNFLIRAKRTSIFILIYTALFALFFGTLNLTVPFVLAIIIALINRPFNEFLIKKLKLPPAVSSILTTIVSFTVVFSFLIVAIVNISAEIKDLLLKIPNVDYLYPYIQSIVVRLQEHIESVDPTIISNIQSSLTRVFSSTFNIIQMLLNKILALVFTLPSIFMIIVITFIATYFLNLDLLKFENKITNIFSEEGKRKFSEFSHESSKMLLGYVKSYSILLSMTFFESLIGFSIFRVNYALLLSFLCAFLDIFPILGIGTVFFPLAIYYVIIKNYFTALGLIIVYILITAVRQIVEPKLISSNLDLNPVMVLAAIFIGIKAYGFLGMLYLIFLMVFYKILRKIDVI
ncbi:hypothetical protein ABG79_02262 [Caloramator mitchellensis]|uniref:Pheromone autoinducer 2 transporter n=1 Tax=Caloramator mitchellensis TaxID=908809 RepID=A0A0R3JR71_CALMK|nr:sporulation integral membrane protein YtvI [Caloramator mitchellensis]KRQ85958.1 hypothetical protein ABG79_02262 [Caloramator mitchellensis]